MSSGGLAVKHPALGANGHRFYPRKRSTFPQINSSAHNIVGLLTTLNGAAVSTELLKIKGDVKEPR